MGLIRKTISISTLGLVDFRSDKERAARSARRTDKATRKGNKLLKEQNRLIAEQNSLARQNQLATPGTPTPGWYNDPTNPALLRWWDGTQWGPQTQPRA